MAEKFIPVYNLESLNEQQRQEYIKAVCKHMGVPDNMNLVSLVYIDDGDGPRQLVAYAKRGAAEIIRNNRGINVINLDSEQIGGSVVWKATGKDGTGRQEISSGSKYIKDLTGKALDDAIMTAQTRAIRRMTLQFVGAGVLDESEINPAQAVKSETSSIPVIPQPIVAPNPEPGKDVDTRTEEQKQTDFEANQKKLREDAIATLNAKYTEPKAGPEPVKKRRGRRPKGIDLGPLDLPAAKPAPMVVPLDPANIAVSPDLKFEPKLSVASVPLPTPEAIQTTVTKARLLPEQVRPFRQRLFNIVNNILEPAGFAPREGMGNPDKMRALATVMFADVNNMNELSAEQWEKYLSILEKKVQTEGAQATVKYIEETIGI